MRSIICAIGATILIGAHSAQATFIGDASGDLWDYDVTTNTSTLIGNSGTMFDIALDPLSDILYGVTSGGSLYSISQTDASRTLIGGTGAFINGLTFGSDGTLYGSGGSGLYSIDLTTGAAGLIGTGGYSSSGDLAFDDMGNLYLSSTTGPGDSLWSIDVNTGAGTLIGQTGFSAVYGLNYADNTLYGFTRSGTTISLDTTTGTGTFVANNSIAANGADGVGGVVNVSEPSSMILLGLGLVGLGLSRRKSKAKSI